MAKQSSTGSAPPAPPTGQQTSFGLPSPDRQAARDFVSQALAAHTNLLPGQQKDYEAAAHAIFDKMTDAGLQRFNANVTGYRFFLNTHELSVACKPGYAQLPPAIQHYARISGAYNETTGELELTGGDRIAGVVFTAQDHYAHEFGHAIDGPTHDVSRTQEWQDAWLAEIRSRPPNPNAATNEREGFAAFSAMVYQTNANRVTIEQQYPLCVAVWRALHLW